MPSNHRISHRGRHRAGGPRSRDRGAAVVEFALVFPLMVLFLLGIVTGGLAYNTKLQVTHASREAARFGATIPVDESFTSGTWAENVRTLAVERSAGDLESADVCVALVSGSTPVPITSAHTTAAGGGACYDDSAAGDEDIRVQVQATTEAKIETGFWSTIVTLTGDATAKHETAQQ